MAALRLLVHAEGRTEAVFVTQILGPYLMDHGYARVDARMLGRARRRDHRGGIRSWPRASRELVRHLREDRDLIVTTMVDYYGLPTSGAGAWPGRKEAASLVGTSSTRAEAVEAALLEDIAGRMGPSFDKGRFEPFVTMHEYEGLLFSDCPTLAESLQQPALASPLSAIRDRFATPEDINDSYETAPSKRLQALLESLDQRYEKPLHGVRAFSEIGLTKIRAECPHFDRWVGRLEARGVPGAQS